MEQIKVGSKVMTYSGLEYEVMKIREHVLFVRRASQGFTDCRAINDNAVFEVFN